MAMQILGGTNFLTENDVSFRMSKDTIQIRDSTTIQATPLTVLAMDCLDTRQRLVTVVRKTSILWGDSLELTVPDTFPSECEILAEPNLQQAGQFFQPKYVEVKNRKFTVENEAADVLCFKKGCQPVKIGAITPDPPTPIHSILPCQKKLSPKSFQTIVAETSINSSGTLSEANKRPFLYYQTSLAGLPG
jgi:hypothetical protein